MAGQLHPIAHMMLVTVIFMKMVTGNPGLQAIVTKTPKFERPRYFDNGLKTKGSLCSTCKRHDECLSIWCEEGLCVSQQWSVETCLALRHAGKVKKEEKLEPCHKCSSYWQCAPNLCIHGRCARDFQERRRCVNETLSTPAPTSWKLCDPCQGKPDDCIGGLCIRHLCVPNVQHLQFCKVHNIIRGAALVERNKTKGFTPGSIRGRRGGKKCARCDSWFQCESLRCVDGRCVDGNQYKPTLCRSRAETDYVENDESHNEHRKRSKKNKENR